MVERGQKGAVFWHKRSQMKGRGSLGVLEGWEEARIRNPAGYSELSDWCNAVGQLPIAVANGSIWRVACALADHVFFALVPRAWGEDGGVSACRFV